MAKFTRTLSLSDGDEIDDEVTDVEALKQLRAETARSRYPPGTDAAAIEEVMAAWDAAHPPSEVTHGLVLRQMINEIRTHGGIISSDVSSATYFPLRVIDRIKVAINEDD